MSKSAHTSTNPSVNRLKQRFLLELCGVCVWKHPWWGLSSGVFGGAHTMCGESFTNNKVGLQVPLHLTPHPLNFCLYEKEGKKRMEKKKKSASSEFIMWIPSPSNDPPWKKKWIQFNFKKDTSNWYVLCMSYILDDFNIYLPHTCRETQIQTKVGNKHSVSHPKLLCYTVWEGDNCCKKSTESRRSHKTWNRAFTQSPG